jgi:hypothetical protein
VRVLLLIYHRYRGLWISMAEFRQYHLAGTAA